MKNSRAKTWPPVVVDRAALQYTLVLPLNRLLMRPFTVAACNSPHAQAARNLRPFGQSPEQGVPHEAVPHTFNLRGLNARQHFAVGAVAMLVKGAKDTLLDPESEPGCFERLKSVGLILQATQHRDGNASELTEPLSVIEGPTYLVADNPVVRD